MLGRDYQDNPQLGSKEATMRLSRTDLVPMLAIIGGGAFAVLTFGSLLLLRSAPEIVPAPDPVVAPSATLELPLDRLEEALRRLEGDRGLFSTDVEKAAARAADLGREQFDIELSMGRIQYRRAAGLSASGNLLFERKTAMHDEIADLEQEIQRLTDQAREDQSEAWDRLREAAATIRDGKLKERVRYSRGLIGIQDREFMREFEVETTHLVEELQLELQRASEAVESQEIRPEDRAAIRAGPVFTPMTERPEIRNRNEIVAALMQEYPPPLRIAGIGGRVVVWFYIIETGQVLDARISRSSGNAELDQAALRVAAIIRFTPARDGNGPVPVWIEVPITFQVRN